MFDCGFGWRDEEVGKREVFRFEDGRFYCCYNSSYLEREERDLGVKLVSVF